MTKQYTPVIDADRMVYAAGFISETKLPDGTTEVAPLNHALQILKTGVQGILNTFEVEKGDDGYWMYLTDNTHNFRNKVATIKPYKGNRKTPKPFWYKEMREYLVEMHGAIIVDRYEADDAVTMKAYEDSNCIIVAQDKDYLQVPGDQYDPVKHEWLKISEHDAMIAYWTQVLTGDVVDNIPGCFKIGPKKSAAILDGAKTEHQCYKRCKDTYQKTYPNGVKLHDGGTISALEALHENCELLHLLRYEGDHWETRLK